MCRQVRNRNSDCFFLPPGSLDRKKAAFFACVLFAYFRCYQARFCKRERHFIPDWILALKDRGVLCVKMVQELLFHWLLKEKQVAIAEIPFSLSSHTPVHVYLEDHVGEDFNDSRESLFHSFRCLPALLSRCGKVCLLDELKNRLGQRRGIERYLGF